MRLLTNRDPATGAAARFLSGYTTNVRVRSQTVPQEAKLNKVVTWHLAGFHS